MTDFLWIIRALISFGFYSDLTGITQMNEDVLSPNDAHQASPLKRLQLMRSLETGKVLLTLLVIQAVAANVTTT